MKKLTSGRNKFHNYEKKKDKVTRQFCQTMTPTTAAFIGVQIESLSGRIQICRHVATYFPTTWHVDKVNHRVVTMTQALPFFGWPHLVDTHP